MSAQQVQDLEPSAAWAKLQEESLTFLDVRTTEEFAGAHVPEHKGTTINVPVKVTDASGQMVDNANFIAEVEKALPDKAAPIMVACRSGARSTFALGLLKSAGYTNLVHQCKGWNGWEAASLPKAA